MNIGQYVEQLDVILVEPLTALQGDAQSDDAVSDLAAPRHQVDAIATSDG